MKSPKEIAEFLNCTRITVYSMIKRGELPAVKFGSQWRIDQDKVEERFTKVNEV